MAKKQQPTPRLAFIQLLEENRPQAMAWVRGGESAPQVSGLVKFYETPYGGTLVEAEVFGLPNVAVLGSTGFYGLHIHEKGDCSANFSRTGEHYNPKNNPHPYHAGDLLPLLSSQGYAWMALYDRSIQVQDVIGRSAVIHANPDDFTSQPSGNSGAKIACGVIERL